MNFQLSICGLPGVELSFAGIWPSLPVADFVAFVIHRVRTELPAGSPEIQFFEANVGRTCIFFSDDGTLRRLLCGPPPGLKCTKQAEVAALGEGSSMSAALRPTCGEAFDVLDDGTKEGLRGWLYFAYHKQTISCVCMPPRDDTGGYRRGGLQRDGDPSATQQASSTVVEVTGVDLIFGDVADIKRAVVARGFFASVHDIIVLVDAGRWTAAPDHRAAATATPHGAALELPDDELLFPLLCGDAASLGDGCQVLVVQRSGITVSIVTLSRRVVLPRFDSTATVADVVDRLRTSFKSILSAPPHLLFLAGREDEGALNPRERLSQLVGLDGEVKLTVDPPRPPQIPTVNEGSAPVRVVATSAIMASPHRRRDGGTLHHHSSPPHLQRRTADTIADEMEFMTQFDPNVASSRKTQPVARPTITCRVDVSDCCQAGPLARGTRTPPVDVVLPNDGLPFTALDLKQFLVTQHVLPKVYTLSNDVVLVHGTMVLADDVDIHDLAVIPPSGRDGGNSNLHNAVVLLQCLRG